MRQWLPLVLALLLVVAAIGISVIVWDECRTEGHSFLYCLRLVSR